MARRRHSADSLEQNLDGVVKLLGRTLNQALKREGLRPSDIQVLELVEHEEMERVRDLSGTLGVSRQAVAKVVGGLTSARLLAYTNTGLAATSRGRALLSKVHKRREKVLDGVLQPLSKKERGQLTEMLARILDAAHDG